jgi:hypothetical protein
MFYGTYRGDNHGGLGGQLYKIRMYYGDRITRLVMNDVIGGVFYQNKLELN